MEIMLLAAAVILPSAGAMLALQMFEFRPASLTDLQIRTATSGGWAEPPRNGDIHTESEPKRTLILPAEHPFPTLQAIDHARGAKDERFATDLHASVLEQRARELVNAWWPETVWLTGLIGQRQLDAVVTRLEHERESLRKDVRIFVTPAGSADRIATTV